MSVRASKHADQLIIQRRIKENALSELNAVKNQFQMSKMTAAWENKTHTKMKLTQMNEKFQVLKLHRQKSLEARKKKLSHLLHAEHEFYKAEIEALRETSEMRQANMLQRARELKAAREEERRKFAEAQLNRKWREESEELRQLDSLELANKVKLERLNQLKQKEEQRQREREEQRRFDELWEIDRINKLRREQEEASRRKLNEEQTIAALDQQVTLVRLQKLEEESQQNEQARTMKARFEQDKLEMEAKEREERERKATIRGELDKANQLKREQKTAEKLKQHNEDLQLLATALEKDRQVKEEELQHKLAQKKEAMRYRQHLELQMKTQTENESRLDQLRQDQLESEWKKREDQWKREEDNKTRLMEEVCQVRSNQVEEKTRQNRKLREEYIKEGALAAKEKADYEELLWREREAKIQNQQGYKNALSREVQERRIQKANETNCLGEEHMFQKQLQQENENKIRQALQEGGNWKNFNRRRVNLDF